MTITAMSDALTTPTFRGEFRELRPERYPMPTTTRYVPRQAAVIGMFDTTRPPALASKGTSHALTPKMLEQAAANRKPVNKFKPHSIATRAMQAMRDKGDWISTGDLIELANRHRPESCAVATRENIYEVLSRWRKRKAVESRQVGGRSQYLEWRAAK